MSDYEQQDDDINVQTEAVLEESVERHLGIQHQSNSDEETGAQPLINYHAADSSYNDYNDNNNNNNNNQMMMDYSGEEEEQIEIPSDPPVKPPNVRVYYVESRRSEAQSNNPDMGPTEVDQMLREQFPALGKKESQMVKREHKALKRKFEIQLQLYKQHNPEFDEKKWYGGDSRPSNKSGRNRSGRSGSGSHGGGGRGSRKRNNDGFSQRRNFLMNSFEEQDSDDDYSKQPKNKRQRTSGSFNDDGDKMTAMSEFLQSIIKGRGGKGKRKKKMEDGESLAPEEAEQAKMRDLCNDMRNASRKDWQQNLKGQPAVYMLRLVPYVSQQLSKKFLHRTFIEDEHCYVLDCIRDWIHPLPDGSLPPVKVRTEMYRIVHKLELHKQQSCRDYLERSNERSDAMMEDEDEDMGMSNNNNNNNNNSNSNNNPLRKEGFPKTLMTLWAHKDETPENKRMLRGIILRLIHQLTQSLRDQEEDDPDRMKDDVKRRNEILRKQGRNHTLAAISGPRKRAAIPERPGFDFAIKPKDQVTAVDEGKGVLSRRMMIEQRFKTMKTTKNNQAMKPSVTGKRR